MSEKENLVMLYGIIDRLNKEYAELVKRYDDALKRIHDMQAELEYLRMEVNRQ